jgi:type IV secretory pathway TraG/TraD family ATPase VirD4
VSARAFSSTNGRDVGSSTSGTTATRTVAPEVVQRHFAHPDELMVMPDGTQIVLIENFNPIRARRLSWLDNEERRRLGINLRKPQATIINLVAPPAPAHFPTVF